MMGECAKCLDITMVYMFDGEYVCPDCMDGMTEDDEEI